MKILSALNSFSSKPLNVNKSVQIPMFKSRLTVDTFDFKSLDFPGKQTRTVSKSNVITPEINDKMIQLRFSNEDVQTYIRLRSDPRYNKLSNEKILELVYKHFSPLELREYQCLYKDYDLSVEEAQTFFDTRKTYKYPNAIALSFIYSDYTPEEIENFSKVYKNMPKLFDSLKNFGMAVPEYIVYSLIRNRITDIDDFKKYLDSIDIEDITKAAPRFKNYSDKQLEIFLGMHYSLGTKEFNKKTLSLNGVLTDILSNQYLNAQDVNNLLVAFPLTSRNIGNLPNEWLVGVNEEDTKQIEEEVFESCATFAKDNDKDKLCEKLASLLGKKVEVSYVASGEFGAVYKIEVAGSKPVCIKVFFEQDDIYCENKYGQFVEPQISLFANNYSDDFVKTYFGRLAGKRDFDAFMVCQFLSNDIEPEQTGYKVNNSYSLGCGDAHEKNFINGKIIDFGAVKIFKDGKKVHKWFA